MAPPASSAEPASRPTLLRLTVVSGTRRADLVVPGAAPVVELLPGLAEAVGLSEAPEGGHRLVTLDGRELAGAESLVDQGVADGAWLAVSEVADPPPRVDDDLVSVVAEVVERDLRHGSAAATTTTSLVAAGVSWVLAALVLTTATHPAVPLLAAALSAALIVSACLVARAGPRPVARGLAWLAVLHAGVAGASFAGRDTGEALLGAGAAVAVVGAAGVAAVDRVALLPAAVAGVGATATGLVCVAGGAAPGVALTVAFGLVVVVGDALPWLAASASGLRAGQPVDREAPPGPVDRAAVAGGVRRAHALLAAFLAAQGLLVATFAPAAVSRGTAGAVLAAAGCLALLLRARRHRVAATAGAASWAALAGTGAVVVAVWWCHPEWRLALAAALAGCGAAVVAGAVPPASGSLRLGRVAELVEGLALVSLPALVVVATGVVTGAQERLP